MEFQNRNPKIYVIAGHARNGKDSVASAILKEYEKNGKKGINLQFSYYIKEYVKKITDWDGNDDTKPREMLQQVGTELIRNQIDSTLFIRRIIDDIKVYSYFFDVITISDARFDKELESLKQVFPEIYCIRVQRPGFEQVLGKLENHDTEKGLVKVELYDKIICNDGSLEELGEKVKAMLEEEEHHEY